MEQESSTPDGMHPMKRLSAIAARSATAMAATATIALLLSATPAAADGLYVSAGGGLLGNEDEFLSAGESVQLAAGWDAGLIRWELEGQWLGNEESLDSVLGDAGVEVDAYTLTLGAYFDFPLPLLNPYVGGAVGFGTSDVEGTGVLTALEENDEYLVLHAEAGLDFPLAPLVSIGPAVRYSYFDTDYGDEFYTARVVLRVGF